MRSATRTAADLADEFTAKVDADAPEGDVIGALASLLLERARRRLADRREPAAGRGERGEGTHHRLSEVRKLTPQGWRPRGVVVQAET